MNDPNQEHIAFRRLVADMRHCQRLLKTYRGKERQAANEREAARLERLVDEALRPKDPRTQTALPGFDSAR